MGFVRVSMAERGQCGVVPEKQWDCSLYHAVGRSLINGKTMENEQKNNPLHGKTLATILAELEAHYGWDGLYARVKINCFRSDPSLKSSLKFLRKTQWARKEVEVLYLRTFNATNPYRKL